MSSSEKIIMLLDHFRKTEAEAALKVYAEAGGDASAVVVAPVTDLMLQIPAGQAARDIAEGRWPGGTPRSGGTHSALIAGGGKAEAVALMRCFRSVLPRDADPAFAMVTEKGSLWPIEEYFAHIRKEHEYMKTADPSQDPDMREV